MYTSREYADMACKANDTGKLLYVLVDKETGDETLMIGDVNYYVCFKDNKTYGDINENYDAEKFQEKQEQMTSQNLSAAKSAIENGYVTYKDVRIETNSQTCNDLMMALLTFQAHPATTSVNWLSKDDVAINLTAEDVTYIGGLLDLYKNSVWNNLYSVYKEQIDKATTLEELEAINIDYSNIPMTL